MNAISFLFFFPFVFQPALGLWVSVFVVVFLALGLPFALFAVLFCGCDLPYITEGGVNRGTKELLWWNGRLGRRQAKHVRAGWASAKVKAPCAVVMCLWDLPAARISLRFRQLPFVDLLPHGGCCGAVY